MKKGICSVHECENEVHAKKLCNKHYRRLRVHGDVCINYREFYTYRKNECANRVPELLIVRLSFEECQFLEACFREVLCKNFHGRQYEGLGLGGGGLYCQDVGW